MADSFVTINSLRLDVDGFCVAQDLTPLMVAGPSRGEDFVSQGVDGQTFRPKARDALRVMLPLAVFGENDSAGAARTSTLLAGLRDNTDTIQTTCVDASRSALVPLVLTFDDATTKTASVWCPRFDVGMYDDSWQAWAAVLEIVIPAGVLT